MKKLIYKLPLALTLIAIVIGLGVIGCANEGKKVDTSTSPTKAKDDIIKQAQDAGLVQIISTQDAQNIQFDNCVKLFSVAPDNKATNLDEYGYPYTLDNIFVCAGKTDRSILKVKVNQPAGDRICALAQNTQGAGSTSTMMVPNCFTSNAEAVIKFNFKDAASFINYVTIVFESDIERLKTNVYSGTAINIGPRAEGATSEAFSDW